MDAMMYSEFSSNDLPYSKVNKKVEKLIRKHGGYTVIPKEVKKVSRPYWGVKVVKVKKAKKDFWCGGMRIGDKQYQVFKRKKGIPYLKEFKKGNFVNGENIDKIKFPCFCRFNHFKDGIQGVHGIGMINKTFGCGQIEYELVRIDYH